MFTTFSDPAVPVNTLIGPGRDPKTHTPEYKVMAVNIERSQGLKDSSPAQLGFTSMLLRSPSR